MTFEQWLTKSEGHNWTEDQTAIVLRHITEIENTYSGMLRQAMKEITALIWKKV